MKTGINFELVPIQFIRSWEAVVSALQRDWHNDPLFMLSWGGGFAAALIGCLILLWIIGKRIDNPAQRHILQSTIPFLYAVAALSANLAFPKENLILFISYGAFYWLAITFMRLPLWLLNLQRTWRYWGASLLLITAFVAILFKDLTYLNALYYYEEHVSLFNLVGIFSKTAIAAALLLYVSYLTPTLGQLATRYWPILRSARLLQGITLSLLGFAALLWIADIVTFGIKLLFGIALAALSVALFNYIRYRSDLLTQKLYPPTIYDTEELIRLRQTLVKALFYTLLFGYCAIAQEWLGFDSIINKLQKVMLIKSEHYRLSLYNLVFAILLFNLLYNYLYLLTKKARRVALWGEAATARSMEAIILNLGILLIFILTALQIGVTWQILLPFAGALGVGIGFGLQTIVNNYLSGFILLFSKKLKIGDIVELDGQAGLAVGNTSPSIVGKIDSIDVLTTNIKTADNIDISIPNSLFLTQKIVNYSHTTPYVRAKIPIGVAYNSNIELVMRLIREALDEAHDVIQTMEKKVILTNYGPSSLDFLALFWIDIQAQHGVLPKGEFMHILWEKFKQHGIEVPFPQQDLWIRNPEALIGKESKSS